VRSDIRHLTLTHARALAAAFAPLRWSGKDLALFTGYLAAQEHGDSSDGPAHDGQAAVGYVGGEWDLGVGVYADYATLGASTQGAATTPTDTVWSTRVGRSSRVARSSWTTTA